MAQPISEAGVDLLVVSVNHRTAPLAWRERLAVPPAALPDALRSIPRTDVADEALILSTCNRVEWYVVTRDPALVERRLTAQLADRLGVAPSEVRAACCALTGLEAVEHLFKVSAGMASMVYGESEITAQIKRAYEAAQRAGTVGPVLHRLLQKAFHATKLIRSRTAIAEGQASIGAVVARLAQQTFGPRLEDCEVLLWGAGKAAHASVRHLLGRGVRRLWIVNRTAARAQDLAAASQARWLAWDEARSRLRDVDLAVVCTYAPHPVLTAATVAEVMRGRERPLCIVDLAVPRNVDPAAREVPGVQLYDVDDLEAVSQTTLAKRQATSAPCEAIVKEQVGYVWRWWKPVVSEAEVMVCTV